MPSHADAICLHLAQGPVGPRQLLEQMGVSQPTLSRAISSMGSEVLRIGAARSIQYALRDAGRGVDDTAVHRVDAQGRVKPLGVLVPVRPAGYVMRQTDGVTLHSDGLPWWLLDMRPQGFLGRAYAARHAAGLGLPASLSEWDDAHVLRALVAHGHDAVGNLLLGDRAREQFLNTSGPEPLAQRAKARAYRRLAEEAASGDRPGSSAGGEQPKFAAFVKGPDGPCHVLVKFSLPDVNPVTQRWRDLLLAEHHALQALAAQGVAAARSWVVDHGEQRFLEVERFDRVGPSGRRAVFSLAALEAEFVGDARAPWPAMTARLAGGGHITPESVEGAALLFAFGTLIGNTDMHHGNLSFTSEHGRPCALAPAYDMLPMGFAPRSAGNLPGALPEARLHASVGHAVWGRALVLAQDYLDRVRAERRFSADFGRCIDALGLHIAAAGEKVARLG